VWLSRDCIGCAFCFGCANLRNKEYYIFNRPYTKEQYFQELTQILQDGSYQALEAAKERAYKVWRQYPYKYMLSWHNRDATGDLISTSKSVKSCFNVVDVEDSAYCQDIVLGVRDSQDFFPLNNKEEAAQKGYLWRDPETREYQITVDAKDLPDNIRDAPDNIVKEIIKCLSCGKAYRTIQMELDFLRRMSLPAPRICPNCRYLERIKHRNPPRFYHRRCTCGGSTSDNGIYSNATDHPSHSINQQCPNEFETSFAPDRSEIVYCEECYQNEVA